MTTSETALDNLIAAVETVQTVTSVQSTMLPEALIEIWDLVWNAVAAIEGMLDA